jgi:uncharacterized protein (DUF3084 family)
LLSQHACEWNETYRHIASSTFRPASVPAAVRVAQQAARIACNPGLVEASVRELNGEIRRRDAAIGELNHQIAQRDEAIRALDYQITQRDETIQHLETVNAGYRNGRIMRLMTGIQNHLGKAFQRDLNR